MREVRRGGEVGRRSVGWGEVGRKGKFWGKERAKKSLGRGKGCVFGSSPKQLEQPHPELVHWWLLVHSSPMNPLGDDCWHPEKLLSFQGSRRGAMEWCNKQCGIVCIDFPVSDWVDSLISPSGLLLVVPVSHQLAVPVSV